MILNFLEALHSKNIKSKKQKITDEQVTSPSSAVESNVSVR